MTETWLPFCVRRPGPPEKVGYGGVRTRRLDEIEGEVKHSMEGTLDGALGELYKASRQASWHLSIPKDGPPLQHYPLEAILWHAGLPGDRRFDTSIVGNMTLIGEEHEDYPDDRLSANQLYWTIEISKAVRRLCPHVAASPPALRVNLWEHRWLSATSCPSGLIPWEPIMAALRQEEVIVMESAAGLYMFTVGRQGELWYKRWDTAKGRWYPSKTDWAKMGVPPGVKLLDVAMPAPVEKNRLDVFALGSDHHTYQRLFRNGRWSGWNDLGGWSRSAPASAWMKT